MQHKLINTGDYLLIVDESEIKKETYCYDSINNILVFYKGSMKNIGFQKVISHLPLNNSPILEGVDLLPLIEDEVDKEAKDYANNSATCNYEEGINVGKYQGFIKAKEKYKYTEKDMINAILFGIQKGLNVGKLDETDSDWVNNYVKSLQQPKMPVMFKCETVIKMGSDMNGRECWDGVEPKTTNSQGLTQWVGEYIY